MAVKPIPDGYHTVTPYLVVEGAAKLIDFLKQAFDAQEIHRPMQRPAPVDDHPVLLLLDVGPHGLEAQDDLADTVAFLDP